MFVIIIALIVGIFVGIIDFLDWGDITSSITTGFLGFLLGGLIGLVLLMIGQIGLSSESNKNYKSELIESVELISITDNHSSNCSIYLYSYAHKDELSYTYLYRTPKGITSNSIRADKVYLNYFNNEEEKPRVDKYRESYHNDFINWLFFLESEYYIVYVPKGSIIENSFNIDLQ